VVELVDDFRKVMLPFTALHFKEDAKNRKMTLGTYAKELAMPMGVSHILAFSQNEERLNLRLARVPEGPTMSFRVNQFSLGKHVRAIQRRPYTSPGIHQHPPIVVTNNFGDATAAPHVKLMRITFQNMFPAINVAAVKLSECRRVVMFNLLEKEGEDGEVDHIVEVRHYAIKATPVGVDRKVRRIIETKIPNLNKLNDIAEYITGTTASGETAAAASTASGMASDSEPEDETSHVVLPQKYSGRGNAKQQKSALKLVELGPRLSLKLVKVERGLGGGDVMYHAHVTKTQEEVRALKARKEKEAMLKIQRRAEQDQNVEKKRKIKEEKNERKKQRMSEREEQAMGELRRGVADAEEDDDDDSEDEDAEASGSDDGSNDE
jgi:ribosome biogenesis protein SSF1/2